MQRANVAMVRCGEKQYTRIVGGRKTRARRMSKTGRLAGEKEKADKFGMRARGKIHWQIEAPTKGRG